MKYIETDILFFYPISRGFIWTYECETLNDWLNKHTLSDLTAHASNITISPVCAFGRDGSFTAYIEHMRISSINCDLVLHISL